MEAYYKAKEKLFLRSRRAVLNVDDTAGRRLARILRERQIEFKTCSAEKGDFCALLENADGCKGSFITEYTLKTAKGCIRVSLPNFAGEFQIMNSLQAAAVALSYGISHERVRDTFAKIQGVKGRMEQVRAHGKQNIHIFIDYAHTPDALEKLLRSIRSMRADGQRIVLLFGCGGDRDRSKRRVMGQIASRLADMTVVTSDNSRSEDPAEIIGDILKGIDKEKRFTVIKDRRSAIRRAILEYTRPGDILVLAGKGHETYEIDRDGVHAFDERQIIKETLCESFGKDLEDEEKG
jgi:UDP-N-acetylmuramoyl-L-alanyl-D-glutamate--2,6-diaminopimelate ligase